MAWCLSGSLCHDLGLKKAAVPCVLPPNEKGGELSAFFIWRCVALLKALVFKALGEVEKERFEMSGQVGKKTRWALAAALAAAAAYPGGLMAQAAQPAEAAQAQKTAAPGAQQQAVVVLRGPAGEVTLDDVRAMALVVLPEDQQADTLSRKNGVQQLALAVYTQMALARQARQQGHDQGAIVQRAEKLAARRTLSESWMTHQANAKVPSAAQLEQYARTSFEQEKSKYAGEPQVHVRHLLVRSGKEVGRTDGQALTEAEALLARIKAGESFAELAKQVSDDKASAARGGELPAFFPGRMVPEFEQAAFALDKPGQLGGPVQTRFGFHLIELIEKKPAREASFEDVKEQLMAETLQQRKLQVRRELWTEAQKGITYDDAAIEALTGAAAKPSRP